MHVRRSVFLIATLLSAAGMLVNFLACMALIGSGSILAWGAFFSSSCYAWIAYFAIGVNWVEGRQIGKRWLFSGTLAAVLALNAGGSFLFMKDYSPSIMLIPALLVSPAILVTIWGMAFQLRFAGNSNENEQPSQEGLQ